MAALVGVSIKPASGGYVCKVPLSALSEDGVDPAEGDSVSYSVDGTVTSVSGSSATIKIDAINGNPVGSVDQSDSASAPADESTSDMGARLRGAAAKSGPPIF